MIEYLDTHTENGKRCCNKLRAMISDTAERAQRVAAEAKADLVAKIVALSNGEPEYADGGVIVPARVDYFDSVIAETVRRFRDAIKNEAYCYGIIETLWDYQMIPEDEYERVFRAFEMMEDLG